MLGVLYVWSAGQKGWRSIGDVIHEQTTWPGHGFAIARPTGVTLWQPYCVSHVSTQSPQSMKESPQSRV